MSDAERPKFDRDACLRAFAAEMQRQATILERDIKAEEDRSHRYDPADVTYPMLAKSLRERRHKVGLTLATLQSAMQPDAEAEAAQAA